VILIERTAQYWLDKAEEARTRAAGMHDPSARDTMLDIAAKYDVMAQRAEGRGARTKTTTNNTR
jgi:hypothetical protein